ncbi:hypothetical protein B0H14DRAFT_2568514 [Mycena olivaceomarginata]|nr:hypothetical protein B0H14DRAFT_2568514 [Mycena olivaceomarginata]
MSQRRPMEVSLDTPTPERSSALALFDAHQGLRRDLELPWSPQPFLLARVDLPGVSASSNGCPKLAVFLLTRARLMDLYMVQAKLLVKILTSDWRPRLRHGSSLQTSADGNTQRALWITAGRIDQVDACAHGACDLLPSTQPAILIDVGNTGTVLWSLLHGIGTALPHFREELARRGVDNLEGLYVMVPTSRGTTIDRLSYNDGSEPSFMRRLKIFLRNPLMRIWETKKTRLTVIIHGIRDTAQAAELYSILQSLIVSGQSRCTSLDIVAISSPRRLRQVAKDGITLMEHKTGSIIYSRNPPPSPRFHEEKYSPNLEWQLLMSPIGPFQPRARWNFQDWRQHFGQSFGGLEDDDRMHPFTFVIACPHLSPQFLSELPVISQAEIQTAITQDGVRIAIILQHIFQIESYKRDITILDHKLPTNDVILDMDLFKRRACRLPNILADFVKILPEAIAIHGVALLNVHPVKAGGFANIYHRTYTNTDMEQVEVALKALKIFHDQSDDDLRKILQKFAAPNIIEIEKKRDDNLSLISKH